MIMTGRKLVHAEKDITAGILKVNDAYDLRLYQLPSGDYDLIVFMKLHFLFKNNGKHVWREDEKQTFVDRWETVIKQFWGGKTFKLLNNGRKVNLNFEFDIQIGGLMFNHWQISVTKIARGSVETSSVNIVFGNVTLDSEDFKPDYLGAAGFQRATVHEFGHMLGLDDEYEKSSEHFVDKLSVMHSAEYIRPRHNSTIKKWLNTAMMYKGIQ
jgi:hypothetical protein